jgi:hypothetical protein
MDKEYLIKITNDIYRLTLLFPKKEPLRYKMRDLANDVLTNLISVIEGDSLKYKDLAFEIKKDIGSLDGFFEIAKEQNWVTSETIDQIQEKYQVIKEEIELFDSETIVPEKEKKALVLSLTSLNTRQKKIVDLLKNSDKLQVGQVQESLPQVTKRTLRRDFDSLVKQGMIKRSGKANLTFYHLADKEI